MKNSRGFLWKSIMSYVENYEGIQLWILGKFRWEPRKVTDKIPNMILNPYTILISVIFLKWGSLKDSDGNR